MNKKGGMLDIMTLFVMFIFILTVVTTWFIIQTGVVNDYVVYNLVEYTDDLEARGIVTADSNAVANNAGNQFINIIYWIDDLWLVCYVLFSLGMIYIAYTAPKENVFSFSGLVYLGIMVCMLFFDIMYQIYNWWVNQLLYNLLPTAEAVIPSFLWFLNNAGLIITIQLVFYLLLSTIDLDISKFIARDRKEEEVKERLKGEVV